MPEENVIALATKIEQRRKQLEAEGKLKLAAKDVPPIPAAPPRVEFMTGEPSSAVELDSVVNGIDIITAYNKFANKGIVVPGTRVEGIKVRCPNPAHEDKNPSAWINTDKQVWTCGACELGGDKFDIAAWYFNMPVPGYKAGKNFPELRARMAAAMGYTVTRNGPSITLTKEEKVTGPDGVTVESGAPKQPEELAPVTEIRPTLEPIEDISLTWKPLCAPGTFLDAYMQAASKDDVPEEYHFWNAMLAISMAIGRDATLRDLRPVFGNLFVCILGRTGSGKSKAKYLLDSLLHAALPYSQTDPASKGVLRTNAPASAEALIWAFQKRVADPSKPKGSDELHPVRGLIDYSELSSLIGRTNRSGSVLVPTLMQFYDMEATVSTVSRTHGTEAAYEPYACAITTSQPKSLRGLLTMSDAASGFLNRWLFISGREKRRIAVGGETPDMTPAIEPLQKIHAWASDAGQIAWSQEAIKSFEDFFHSVLTPIIHDDETDMLSRLDLLAKKLILLFTANGMHDSVRPESVELMKQTVPYLLECYGVPGAQVGTSLQEDMRTEILKAIVSFTTRKGKGPSSRDINQIIKRKKYPLDLYNKTLRHMTDIEEIFAETSLPEGGRGRPTTRYTVGDSDETNRMIAVLKGKKGVAAEA